MIKSSPRNIASDPNEFFRNPKFAKLIEVAKADIQKYWYDNVSTYFPRAEQLRSERARMSSMYETGGQVGQMRNACRVSFINGQFVVIFKAVTSKDGKDYGDFLVYGTGISPGVFVPSVGARVRNQKTGELEGFTRGISTEAWMRWKTALELYVDKRMVQLMDEIYAESSFADILGRRE
jgi:hypothetical protein